MRWPAKVAADRQLGQVEERLGVVSHADVRQRKPLAPLLWSTGSTCFASYAAQLLEAQDALAMARQLR